MFVGIAANGDVTTRNQQVAQLLGGDDKTLNLAQKVVTVRMLGDIAVANGTYTLHHKLNSGEVDEKGVFTQVFERVARRLAVHQLAAHNSARRGERQTKETDRPGIGIPLPAFLTGATKGRNNAPLPSWVEILYR